MSASRCSLRKLSLADFSLELCDLVESLDGVAQDPVWHPEGDALFHSLQVFMHGRAESDDPELWAAALVHDVGKGLGGHHEVEGARMLDGLLSTRVVWLVEHHLDLLRLPAKTRRRLRGTARLRDLELLRRWDVAGRDPDARVCSVQYAVRQVVEGLHSVER